jgi:hypothetical protein
MTNQNDPSDLTDLGFSPFFLRQWKEIDTEGLTPPRR